VEFLSSFEDYVRSLARMTALQPERICLAHGWVLSGGDAPAFLKRSLDETYRFRELIESYLDGARGNVSLAIENMAHAEYDVKGGIYQERAAYLTNLTAQVKLIAALREQ
jgi:glyoxylase-like metal-dependent hydrolase (beta-lactamase superfamily II)